MLLKPHIDLIKSNGGLWRGDIMAVTGWWDSYRRMLLLWARIAEKEGVEMLSVSCELTGVSRNERAWRSLIAAVREVYKGKLTAAANWAPPKGGGELVDKVRSLVCLSFFFSSFSAILGRSRLHRLRRVHASSLWRFSDSRFDCAGLAASGAAVSQSLAALWSPLHSDGSRLLFGPQLRSQRARFSSRPSRSGSAL